MTRAASQAIGPVFALMRIDRVIEPSTIFTRASSDQRAELLTLGAVRELTDAEVALADKLQIPTYVEITK